MLGIAVVACLGCAGLGNLINHRSCMYGGTQMDLAAIVYPPFILSTYGLSIPLGLLDLPGTFVVDTLLVEQNWGKSCPSWSESIRG